MRATDKVGYTDLSPAQFAWTIDTRSTYASCEAVGGATTCTFPATEAVPDQTWVVPDGVTQVRVRADAAAGTSPPSSPITSGTATGGKGGRSEATKIGRAHV